MHDIAYIYSNNSNRLDTITADGIKSSKYGYDRIGNLTRDGGEGFDVSWTAFNKVKSVTGRNLTFAYSPLGQRQIKRSGTVSEYYIHDAVGNVLAVYRHDLRQEGFYVTERPIYGSSRIGILSSNLRTIPFMPFYSWRHSRAMGQRSYELTDHLGNVATVISDRKFAVGPTGFVVYYIPEIRSYTDYYSFGFPIEERTGVGGVRTRGYRYGFGGQEKDNEIYGDGASYTAEFWQYDARLGRRWNVEPLASEFPWVSTYATFNNNPINFIDPDGREPIRPHVGTSETFRTLLNNSPRGVGHYTGQQAANYLRNLGNTEFSRKQMRPLPTETGYFNDKEGRYIYTENGGWIDMSHFMFYAGRAYDYKLSGEKNPIGKAVQDGYRQEMTDRFAAPHSAYSYEDLPSNKFGAEFGAKYFDPNSKQTFGEQVENYLNNILKATDPTNAPNYNNLPNDYPDKPTRINKTTTPVYIKDNP